MLFEKLIDVTCNINLNLLKKNDVLINIVFIIIMKINITFMNQMNTDHPVQI